MPSFIVLKRLYHRRPLRPCLRLGRRGAGIIPHMRSAIIVYNPAAGRYSVRPFVKSAVRELEAAGWKVDAAETQSGAHTVELAKQATLEKKDAVFAIGGEGTIGKVAKGMG